MYEILNLLIRIYFTVFVFIFYILLISFFLEKISFLHLFFKDFNYKKSDSVAQGAALNYTTLYFIISCSICIYMIFFENNNLSIDAEVFIFILFLFINLFFSRILYEFCFHFQGRTKPTSFRKNFSKRVVKLKKKFGK